MAFDQAFERLKRFMAEGSPVIGFRDFVAAYHAQPQRQRDHWRRDFRHPNNLERLSCRAPHPNELTALEAILGDVPELDWLLKRLPIVQEAGAGSVWIPTRFWIDRNVVPNGFGAINPLVVRTLEGGPRRLNVEGAAFDARVAYDVAVSKALEYLSGHALGGLDATMVLNKYGFDASTNAPALEELRGGSLALPVSLAVLSQIFQKPVDGRYVFTGAMSPFSGDRVLEVEGLGQKYAAAEAAGLTLVYPRFDQNGREVAPPGEDSIGVATMTAAVCLAFPDPESLVRATTTRLSEYWRPLHLRDDWSKHDNLSGAWLVTAVGSNDPWGTANSRGPILTIANRFRPRGVLLIHTPDQEFVERARAVRGELEGLGCTVQMRMMEGPSANEAPDPTDFATVFQNLRTFVFELLQDLAKEASEPAALYKNVVLTNVSSGTPQIQMAMHLIVERRLLPDYRLQVLEPRFPGERVKRVVLTPL